jgi:hypothetical protein
VVSELIGVGESTAMNQVPHEVDREGERRDSHDGLAAVAISLLFVALVVFLISQLI